MKCHLKKYFFLLLLFAFIQTSAQIPSGYYDAAQGLKGQALKTALFNIIFSHTTLDYSLLPDYYPKSDNRPDNTVWDIYSDVPGGTPPYVYHHIPADQCGSYTQEGDCYNREHTLPSSWFNDAYPMRSDLFQVLPTDGWVNNKRSNFPYGEVGSASWTSQNGSKLGGCNYPGYSGTVFEPIDEYKGDLARIYFYMVTCYQNQVAGWYANSAEAAAILNANNYKVFKLWYINLLFQWHHNDPVSLKETARNDTVFKIQGNRNPYVDHPDWADSAWFAVTSEEEFSVLPSCMVFPNPAQGNTLQIISSQIPLQISFFDVSGREVMIIQSGSNYQLVDVSQLRKGMYIIRLVFSQGSIHASCFIN